MLTYQLHTRVFKLEPGQSFGFPNKATLRIKLGPGTAFGMSSEGSRTVVHGRKASFLVNANTGRTLFNSTPPLEPLEVTIESPNTVLKLTGDELTYTFPCSCIDELDAVIAAWKWLLPPLLSLGFSDPPIIEQISGTVGETAFRWEHRPEEWRINFRIISKDSLEEHFVKAVELRSLFQDTNNRRLMAAITYFHVAVRLSVSGDSAWEFMAESVLNYAKCLDILFATTENSKDDARKGLEQLGYTPEEVEGDFIPILILRSYVDVAHPRVAIYKPHDLNVLYRYMARAEEQFRKLLLRILDEVKKGEFQVAEANDLTLDAGDRKGMDRLVAQMESRLSPSVEGDAKP